MTIKFNSEFMASKAGFKEDSYSEVMVTELRLVVLLV